MDFRSRQCITKSNGFSLPLSSTLRHTHIGVLRFAYSPLLSCLEPDSQLDRGAEREAREQPLNSTPVTFSLRIWWRNGCERIISGMLTTSLDPSSLFKRRLFDPSIIVLCVRWYITYKLSYRDLRDMMAERGIVLAHTTILRWVLRYVSEFEKKWNHFAHPVGASWGVDETYMRVRVEWKYLYRAVDKQGYTVLFLLSERRDIAAAKRFFTRAIERQRAPEKITVDGWEAVPAA